ncbi:MAG: glycine betaine/proline transport system ATP-binding protein [Psychromonas sp.]|jgi:glycine betaine/proline transport system ATP-binding protein|uniref:quaternary amine ABC transporter ATP-binding protein n=1 Tax=Psychromonas sp. TaxID=1884585 RepID=UPI0039E72A68
MTKSLIKIEGLYKLFGRNPSKVMAMVEAGKSKEQILTETGHTLGLKNINLDIKRGEVFVIMGLSGSGKSTLIRHFNRLIDPTKGVISIEGTDIIKLSPKQLQNFRRHKMSMVFQNFGLMPHRSVIENVAYGLKVQGVAKVQRLAKAQEWLDRVGLGGYEQQYPSQLSGGEQQRIGLARALCTDAEILLMDEAFSALDPLIRSEMQDQLIELQQSLHKTIIFITHDLDEALRLGDRIAILKDGEVVQQGSADDILLHPGSTYVESFVKNVNRARVLTVATVMQPAARLINADNINLALEQMKQLKWNDAYHVTGEGYQGLLTQDSLEAAAKIHGTQSLASSDYQYLPTVSPAATIESILSTSLATNFSLPVVDQAGNLIGELTRNAVAEVFAESKTKTLTP